MKRPRRDSRISVTPPFWNLDTARLWSARLVENFDVPSPRATKYRYSVGGGLSAASIAACDGNAIGVGGKPSRV